MGLLTIILVFLFIAVWKAPAWVARNWTYSSLIVGILSTLLGFAQAGDAISKAGAVSMDLIASGVKIALIPIIYGGLIYLVSPDYADYY